MTAKKRTKAGKASPDKQTKRMEIRITISSPELMRTLRTMAEFNDMNPYQAAAKLLEENLEHFYAQLAHMDKFEL